jgi:hypothetical protein
VSLFCSPEGGGRNSSDTLARMAQSSRWPTRLEAHAYKLKTHNDNIRIPVK